MVLVAKRLSGNILGIYDCASSLTGDEPGLRSRGVPAYEAGEAFAAVEERAAAISALRTKWNCVGGRMYE